jgi:hypothetical protein
MLNLDLRKPLYISAKNLAGYFLINNVTDYQPQKNQTTKFELIPYIQYTGLTDTEDIFDISEPTDIPVGENGGGNGGDGAASPYRKSAAISGSYAEADGSAISYGIGTIANINQASYGRFNANLTDENITIIGVGLDNDNRRTGLVLFSDGTLQIGGGNIYLATGEKVITPKYDNGGNLINFEDVLKRND